MGLLTTVGGILGFVNNNETASNLAKDMSNGVDALFYMPEEEARDNLERIKLKGEATVKASDAWIRMIEFTKNSEVYRSVTRRILAVGIIFNLFCMIWICIWCEMAAMFHWFGMVSLPASVPVAGVVTIQLTSLTWAILKIAAVFQLGWVFATIVVFYFGPQLVQYFGNKKGVK